MLPPISPRNAAVDFRRKPPSQLAAGADAAADRHAEQVDQWSPSDVAEWLYLQGTKDDYSHTFMVNGIDGPALLGLDRERLMDWKVRPADSSLIMKGVQSLAKRKAAATGQQLRPNAPPQAQQPVDAAAEPKASPRTSKRSLKGATAGRSAGATGAPAPAPAASAVI